LGFGVWGLGFGVWGLGFGVWGGTCARDRWGRREGKGTHTCARASATMEKVMVAMVVVKMRWVMDGGGGDDVDDDDDDDDDDDGDDVDECWGLQSM